MYNFRIIIFTFVIIHTTQHQKASKYKQCKSINICSYITNLSEIGFNGE